MSKLFFLPIDIDLTGIENFKAEGSYSKMTEFNSWWDSSILKKEDVQDTVLTRILDQLPIDQLTMLLHKIQEEEVPSHVDVNVSMQFLPGELKSIFDNEPAGYRIVVHGKDDVLDVFNGSKWVNVKLPTVPCCYLLNSTVGKHRVKYDEGREIIYFRGFLNPEKHQALIKRSLEKYKDYAVFYEPWTV